MTKVLFVIAPQNFRDEELLVPLDIFKKAGIECIIASKKKFLGKRIARGALGAEIPFDLDIKEVQVNDFEGIVLVGGNGALIYEGDKVINKLLTEFVGQDKLVAAICIAPRVLATGGFLSWQQATVWNGDGQQSLWIEEKGGLFVDQAVVVSGRIVTANGPQSAEVFAEKINEMLLN